jgi:hypothetical protein
MLNDGLNAQTSSSLLANDAPAVDNNQYSHDFSNYPATPSSTYTANGNTSGIVQRPNDPNANSTTATSSARVYPVVEVEAPENLSEGYTFDVQVNHEILTITVVSRCYMYSASTCVCICIISICMIHYVAMLYCHIFLLHVLYMRTNITSQFV